MRIFPLLTLIFFIFLNQVVAQEKQDTPPTPEEEFSMMRVFAGEGRYSKAKITGRRILTKDPDYFDAALYLARIYGWESRYDSAYMILEGVLAKEPELFGAYETLVDVAYWENNWAKLEQYAARALELDPDSEAIMEKYLLAKSRLGVNQNATELFLQYSYDHFNYPYTRNWHMLTAGGNIPIKIGMLSPYINGGYHTGVGNPSTDLQFNLDAYLTLGKKNYALAGYGISPDGLVNYLPRHRAAAEIWQVLPKGYAVSAGLRYFYWNRHFTFLTISEEKYAGNYWFSLRSYLFFKDYGVSGSYYLSTRRYFKDKFNHLTLTVGYGTAPDEPLLVVSDLDRLKAISGRLEYSKQINHNIRLSIMTGYAYEEFLRMEYRHRFDTRAGIYVRLRK